MNNIYPVINEGYGVFISPRGGYIFPYKDIDGVKRPLPRCEVLNVQACAILAQCTGSHTVEEIVRILQKEFEDTPPDLCEQVESLLEGAFQKKYLLYSDTPIVMKGLLQGSLTHYTPTHVLIETTTFCNLQCKHCLLSAGEPLPDELTSVEFIFLIKRLLKMGVNRLNLSGGEILTKKGWDALVHFCNTCVSTSVLTNGVLITEEAADTLTDLKEIHISLYGKDAKTHEKISGVNGSFERAVQGIKLLAERGVHVGVSVLLVPFNLYQLEDMVALAISLKCTMVRVGLICPIGRARDNQWELTKQEKRWLDKTMIALKEKYAHEIAVRWEEEKSGKEHKCGAGFTRWVITANGDVYPCGSLRVPIGNVVRDELEDICTSPAVRFLQELRAPHKELCGDCPLLYLCEECHGQALAHYTQVDTCHWAAQFETAPHLFNVVKMSGGLR